jgi:nucleoside-diphosphate-sugar epimerase
LKKSILVTGAGGFIGRHLCHDLAAEGHSVIGIDVHYPPEELENSSSDYRAVTGDFRNRVLMNSLLDGIDCILHLASAHLEITLSEAEYQDINVISLEPLLELARQNGVKRFVHVSSAGVYGNLESCPADEQTPCNPQNTYGKSKLAGEIEVNKYFNETNFPIIILRPAWVYGPGCSRMLRIYRTLAKNHFVMVGNGSNLRHPLFIKDMLAAFRLVLESDRAVGETILIGGEEAISTRELLDSFCRVLNLPEPRFRLPMKLGELIAAVFEAAFTLIGKEPPVSRRSLEFFNTTNAFDISKARRLLGFRPTFSLEEGLKESRVWLENQYAGKPL